jgi:hypothetical protein
LPLNYLNLAAKKQKLSQELDNLRANNAITLREKEDKIAFLSNASENLSKEKNLKSELNNELMMQKDNLIKDLEKAKLARDQLKDELSSEVKLLENKLNEVNDASEAYRYDNEVKIASKDDAVKSLDEAIVN